ncbi:2'-5' RNA ligase family protein [Thermoproteota archaeon]
MRLFIGILCSEDLKKEIKACVSDITYKGLRWLLPSQWHITLIPPITAESDGIANLLQPLCRERHAFPIRFDRISLAPKPYKPRLLWVSGSISEPLIAVRDQIYSRLAEKSVLSLPAAMRHRPLLPHITVARMLNQYKQARHSRFQDKGNQVEKRHSIGIPSEVHHGRDNLAEARPAIDIPIDIQTSLTGFSIIESHLSEKGSFYTEIKRFECLP